MEFIDCDVCHGAETKPLFKKQNNKGRDYFLGPIVVCKKCGLAYVNPRNEDRLEKGTDLKKPNRKQENTQIWEPFIEEERWKKKDFADRLVIIKKYKAGGKLLDVGCGIGFFLQVAQQDGFEVKGADPSFLVSNYARERLGLDVFTGTLMEMMSPKQSFDIITSLHVLEHVPSPSQFLAETRRILKDDGILVIEVPNMNNLLAKVIGFRFRSCFDCAQHYYYFTKKTLRLLLEKNGFEILKEKWVGRNMSVEWFIRTLERNNSIASKIAKSVIAFLKLGRKTIRINIGDKILVVARKTPSGKGLDLIQTSKEGSISVETLIEISS